MQFKVAVWNCFAGTNDQTNDLRFLAEPLKAVDVALLNELERGTNAARGLDQPSVIAKTAGFSYVYWGKRFDWDGGERVDAILSRYPLYNKRFEVLPQRPFWVRGFGAPGPRVLVQAEADFGGDLGRVRLGSTRWTNNAGTFDGEGDRVLQAARCVELFNQGSGPLVWGGDLNANPTAGSARIVRDVYKSAMDALAYGGIDYLFHSRSLTALQPQVIKPSTLTGNPSDHDLLIATMSGVSPSRVPPAATPTPAPAPAGSVPASITGHGDYIAIDIQNAGLGANVEIVLDAAPNISWYKEVRLGDRKAWTKDSRRRDAFQVTARQLAAGELVFSKARFFGFVMEVHRLSIPVELHGKRLTFRWVKDS